MLVGDYSFLDVLWWMIAFFAFVIWFWLLITVFGDIFRRHDTSGIAKTLWIIFIIILPFLGVFIYLIAQHQGMAERNMKSMQAAQAQQEAYIKSVATTGGSRGGDREGQEAARLRRDHAGGVRHDEGEGARLVRNCRFGGRSSRPSDASSRKETRWQTRSARSTT